MLPFRATSLLSLLLLALLVAELTADRRHRGRAHGRRHGYHRDNSEELDEDGDGAIDRTRSGHRGHLTKRMRRLGWHGDRDDSDTGSDSDSGSDSSPSSEEDDSDRQLSHGGDDWDVGMLRLQPSGLVNVGRRNSRHRYSRLGGRHGGRKTRLGNRDEHIYRAMAEEAAAPVGGKLGLGISEMLPDMDAILPHFHGNLQVGPKINIRWNLGELLGLNADWWKGPNVCQSEYETESNSTGDISRHGVTSQTRCDNTDTTYTCTTSVTIFGNTKTFVTTYECCHGYQRVPGESGCTEELKLTDLLSTAERLNLTEFTEAVTSVGLNGLLQTGNFTVFAPVNEAFDSIVPPEMEDSLQTDFYDYDVLAISPSMVEWAENLEQVLGGHLVEGFLKSPRLEDEMILDTTVPNAQIRINKYEVPKTLVTANCQPIVSLDNQATNGVIHVVSGILDPVKESLLDLVGSEPELSTLKTLLTKTGLSSELSEIPGQMTLFAPTNAAFSAMDPKKLDRLLGSKTCLSNVLKHHLVGNVICSSILQGEVRTLSTLGQYLHFNQSDRTIMLEAATMTERDLMATNGVLHKIDTVLIPDQALGVLDIAEKVGATDFMELLAEAGLTKTLETQENVTLFLPTNEAVQDLPAATLASLRKDPVALGKVLKYHVVPELISGRSLCDGQEMDTLDSDKTIRVKDYSSFPFSSRDVKTIQCAPVNVKNSNVKACNGVIHMIDKVMLPPPGDVLDVLSLDSRFSTLVGLLKTSGIAENFQLSGPFTFFAPTNQAFEKVPDDVMEGFTQGSKVESLRKLLQHHIMYDSLCCSGIMRPRYFTSPRERMLDGSTVLLTRSHQDEPTVNSVSIASCDLLATNGIVHAIDDLIPEAVRKYTQNPARVTRVRGQGSRLSRLMDHMNRRVETLRARVDDFEWEIDWPAWMRRGI